MSDSQSGEQIIPREVAEQYADAHPTLRSMIDRGVPLSRNAYLFLAYGGEVPEPFTAEHEAELPEPFQQPVTTRGE